MGSVSGSRGFSGQSLNVHVGSEGSVFRKDHPWSMSGGGPDLNRILRRALDPSFTYLQHLDEYGNTVFSKFQMEAVIPELRRLTAFTESTEQGDVVEELIRMAEVVQTETHFYLVFVGD